MPSSANPIEQISTNLASYNQLTPTDLSLQAPLGTVMVPTSNLATVDRVASLR